MSYILFFILFTIIIGIYTSYISSVRENLKEKIHKYEMFLDTIKVFFNDSNSMTFLGTQDDNSIFFQLQFGKSRKEIYRLKWKQDIIRFDRVLDTAWYKQNRIDNFHVNKMSSIDLRKYKNEGFSFIYYFMPNIRKYANELDQIENNLDLFIHKLTTLWVQKKKISRGLSVSNMITEDEILKFVKNNFNETSD